MRLAYLSTMTGYYGGEVHLAQLAQGMRERGHEVVAVVRPGSELATRLAERGLPVETLAPVDWFDAVSMARLQRWLPRRGIQILHTHLPRDYYIAAAVTLGTGVGNVGTRHLLRPISKRFLKRPFLRRFQAMIAVSEAVRTSLLASPVLDPERVKVVLNGIQALDPDPHRWARWRLAQGLAPTDPVIGYVGLLAPQKGLKTLLTAVHRLQPHHPRLRVLLLGAEQGSGGYGHRLREMTAALGLTEQVKFLGYVEGAAALAGAFDVQVVCSAAEPFGLVTLEAMAAARPVVVTDTGGSPELVRDGVEGFLVPPGDSHRLAVHLDCLLNSPGLRTEMGGRGRQRVCTEFTLDRMLRQTEAVYRRVADRATA